MLDYILVMAGGALGTGSAILGFRDLLLKRGAGSFFPLGTLVVNVTGSFAIGFFAAFHGPGRGVSFASPRLRQFFHDRRVAAVTRRFSSFSLQTLDPRFGMETASRPA